MIGYGVAATCFAGLGITLVVRRESGILKRIRATPLPAMTYLFAVLASTFVVFLIEAVLIIAIGRAALLGRASPIASFSLAAVLALGALSFAALGLGITGLVRSAEGSSAVINAVYLPMAIISGTFFSPKSYPEFLRIIADVLPLTHYTELTRDVMLRHHHFWADGGAIAHRRRLGRDRPPRRGRAAFAGSRARAEPPRGGSRRSAASSSPTRQRLDPFGVVARRPVLAHPAAGDAAERVARRGEDQRR